MKKTFLSLAIASLVLVSCSDNKSAEAQKNAEQVTEKIEQKAIDTTKKMEADVKKVVSEAAPDVDLATRGETVFKALTDATQTYYGKLFKTQPMLEFSYELVSYDKGDKESKAVTKAMLELYTKEDGKTHHELTLNHVIKHDSDIVKITSEVEKPKDMGDDAQKLFDNFRIVTDVDKHNAVSQIMSLASTSSDCTDEETNCKNKATIKGFNIHTKSTLEKMPHGFGDFTGKFEGLTFEDEEARVININPFEFKGFYKEDFEFAYDTTPVSIDISEDNVTMAAEKITSSGHYELKEDLGLAVGKYQSELANLTVTGAELPTPIKFKSINFHVDTSLTEEDMVNSQTEMKILPEGDTFKMLTQGKLNVKEADMRFSMHNIKTDAIKKYQTLMRNFMASSSEYLDEAEQTALKEKAMAEGGQIFDLLKSAGADMGFGFNVRADEGDIGFDSKFNLLKDSTVTFEQLKGLEDPKLIFQILNITADASVPAPLLEAIAGEQIMMLGMFMQKDGDVYKSKITTENGQMLINGMPAPMP